MKILQSLVKYPVTKKLTTSLEQEFSIDKKRERLTVTIRNVDDEENANVHIQKKNHDLDFVGKFASRLGIVLGKVIVENQNSARCDFNSYDYDCFGTADFLFGDIDELVWGSNPPVQGQEIEVSNLTKLPCRFQVSNNTQGIHQGAYLGMLDDLYLAFHKRGQEIATFDTIPNAYEPYVTWEQNSRVTFIL